MFMTAMVWAGLIIMAIIAIGFIFCACLFLIGVIDEIRKKIKRDDLYDPEGLLVFSFVSVLSALVATGCVIVVLKIWGHLA